MSDTRSTITRTALGAPGAGPYAVAVDADGVVWCTLVHAGQVAHLAPGGAPVLVDLGNAESRPSQLAPAAEGGVWVTRGGDDRIDRLETSGRRDSFAVPAGAGPYGITVGPDGAVWFTAIGADAVGRLVPDAAGGTVTMFDLPGDHGMPTMITTGPDGAVWFALNRGGALCRITPDGEVTPYPLPDPECGPVGITGDGAALWVAEIAAGRVARLVPGNPLREFDLPDRAARPHAVVGDGAGGCWVTLWAQHALAHLDARGAVTAVHAFDAGTEPHGVAVAPDGAVLVALESGYLARVGPQS